MTYADYYTESHALVIGISEYVDPAFPSLAGAVRDAQNIAGVLESDLYRFEVRKLIDEQATKSAIQDALNDLQTVDPDSRSIVYFAGHGENIRNKFGQESGVIFAHDSRKNNRFSWLNLEEVTDLRGFTTGKHLLFIFDSCFSGKALGLTNLRSAADRYIEKAAYQVLTGGAVEVVVDNRSMTRMLLPLLESQEGSDPLRLSTLFPRLQDVMEAAHCIQTPQAGHLEGSEGGDFVFYVPRPPLSEKRFDLIPTNLRERLFDPDSLTRWLAISEARFTLEEGWHYTDVLLEIVRRISEHDSKPEIQELAEEVVSDEEKRRLRFEIHHPSQPEMVPVPDGAFLMGSPKADKLRFENETEELMLSLEHSYAIGKYPVTVGQYRAFVVAGGYENDRYWTEAGLKARAEEIPWIQPRYWDESPWIDADDLPVVGVSWYEAFAYTCWLAKITGKAYRLPTEAEWEKAARGGLQLPDSEGYWKDNPKPARIWPWGDERPNDKLLNFDNNVGHTTPVGLYERNISPFGLLDMAGNVWEWCLTKWTDPYQSPPSEDNDEEGDFERVVRGGSWSNSQGDTRCSCRLGSHPSLRTRVGGFRVCIGSSPIV